MKESIGAIWFLLAIALATYLLNKVYNKKYNWIYVLVIAYVGYKTSKYIWLPFSVQAGMVGTLFLYLGSLANKYKIFDKKIDILEYIFLIGIVVFCTIYCGELYMVSNTYTNGFIDVIGALAGTFLCIKISQLISKHSKYIKKFFVYIGKNSLTCLCIHLISLDCFAFGKIYNFLTNIGIHNVTVRQSLVNIVWVLAFLMIINAMKKEIIKIKEKKLKNENNIM